MAFTYGDHVCWTDSDGRGGKLAHAGRYVGPDPHWSDRSVVTGRGGNSAHSVLTDLLRPLPESMTVTVKVGRDEVNKVLRMIAGNLDMADPGKPIWQGDDCAVAEVLFYQAVNQAVVDNVEPF